MVNVGLPPAEIVRFVSLGHPSYFQRLSHLGFVTAATSLNGSQPNFARCLAVSCMAGTLYIHFWGILPRYGILPGAKFNLHPPSLVLSFFYMLSHFEVTRFRLTAGRLKFGEIWVFPPNFLGVGKKFTHVGFQA